MEKILSEADRALSKLARLSRVGIDSGLTWLSAFMMNF